MQIVGNKINNELFDDVEEGMALLQYCVLHKMHIAFPFPSWLHLLYKFAHFILVPQPKLISLALFIF